MGIGFLNRSYFQFFYNSKNSTCSDGYKTKDSDFIYTAYCPC